MPDSLPLSRELGTHQRLGSDSSLTLDLVSAVCLDVCKVRRHGSDGAPFLVRSSSGISKADFGEFVEVVKKIGLYRLLLNEPPT